MSWPSLAESWDMQAERQPASYTLDQVRGLLRSVQLPIALETLAAQSGFGRFRLRSAIHTLEALGEIQLDRRGRAVHATITPNRPDAGKPTAADAALH